MTLKERLDKEFSPGTVHWLTAAQVREMLNLRETRPEIESALDELGFSSRESAHWKLYAVRLALPGEVSKVKRTRKSR